MQGCRCADSEKPKFKIQTLKLKKKFSGHATTEFCHNDATGARLFRLNSFNFVLRSLIFSSFVLSFRRLPGQNEIHHIELLDASNKTDQAIQQVFISHGALFLFRT